MWILIKQVLKSLRHSATLIAALIFISVITVFISFSGLYINSNISDSLNNIRVSGNASDVIIEKKYNDSNVDYTFDAISDGKQPLFVSNYIYDSVNIDNNIIFPFSTSDFNGPNVNDKWILQTGEAKPSYYDEFLPRYANRKKGINRAITGPTGLPAPNGAAVNIGTQFSSWKGIGYSMSNIITKEQLFDPQYLLFSGTNLNNVKIDGYFDYGNINSQITASESTFAPKIQNFTPTDIGVAKLPNFPFHRNSLRGIGLNETYSSPYINLYSDFTNTLRMNVNPTPETTDIYNIEFNAQNLTGINKFVWDEMLNIQKKNNTDPTLLTDKERELLLIFNRSKLFETIIPLPIRQLWIDKYNLENSIVGSNEEAIKFFLGNRVSQLQDEFKNFVISNRDYFIENYLFTNGYEFNDNKSFSFYDRDSKKNLLIAQKDSNINKINNKENDWINKLILYGNSAPFLSGENFQKFIDLKYNFTRSIPIISSSGIDYERPFFTFIKYISHFLLNSTISGSKNTQNIFETLRTTFQYIYENIKLDKNNEIILPQFTDPNAPGYLIPGILQKMFAWIELNLWDSGPKTYNNYSLKVLFKEGVSTITEEANFFIPNFSSYQIVVNDKFLNEFNKEIIPIGTWNNLLNKNYTDFNLELKKIDQKHKITIGTYDFIITGSGVSPEMAYPSPSLSSIIINPKNDILLYLDKSGYEMVRNLYVPSAENNYFAIDLKTSKGFVSINKLNEELMPIMNDGKEKVCYSIANIFSAENILALRYSFPDIIQSYISIFSIISVVGLIIIGLYLSFIIMKKYIDKNRVQLALCKANGFSTFKLSIGLSSISVIVALLGGSIGYLIAYFLQSLIYSIVSPYMFIPVLSHVFSAVGFISAILIIAILFFSFVYINLYFLFRKPINLIIAQNVEIKSNKLLNILKYQKLPMTANLKFKFAITLSNVPRTFFYLTSCFVGITVISFGLSFVSKFNESQELTDINKNYVYSIDLQSPNEQSGLLKLQDYSDLGFSDESIGVRSIYPDTLVNGPFPYDPTTLIVRNLDGTQKFDETVSPKKPLYFSNIVLPSYELYKVFNNDIDIFRNAVFSKWLLDFDIPVLNVNVWDTVKNSFPSEFVTKIESENQIFLNAILATPAIGAEFQTFAKLTNNIWQLDGNKILAKQLIGQSSVDVFKKEFIIFIGKVYGDENLSNLDVKLSYGAIGYEKNTDETYTYIDASFLNKYLLDRNDNKDIKFYGINPKSNFVTLNDNDKKFIGDKLDHVHVDPNIKYIIINNGASLKYGLNKGDRIDISVNNSYLRNSENIFNSLLNSSNTSKPQDLLSNTHTLEVIDISSTSFGEEFFISQDNANEILGFKDAKFVADVKEVGIVPNNTFATDTIVQPPNYVPFNGIYSNSFNPIILSNTLSYYSFINLYGNFFNVTNSGIFYRLIENSNINLIIEAITPHSQQLFDAFNKVSGNLIPLTRDILKSEILKSNGLSPLIIDYIIKNFGTDGLMISLKDFSNYYATQDIYSSLVSTLTLIQNLFISLIIPLVAIIILIMSSIMLEEIKRMIFIFKTLGYSDRQNIFNIIFNFVPIYLVSIAIGFLITFLLFLSMQYLIYFLTSIFISSTVNVLNWVYSSLAILGIIFINIIFTIILYKKDKLSEVMKINF